MAMPMEKISPLYVNVLDVTIGTIMLSNVVRMTFYELLLLCIVVYKAVGIIIYNCKLNVVLTVSNTPRCKSYYVPKKPRSSTCRKCHM